MEASELNFREIKGLLFIKDSLLYHSRTPTLQALADHVGLKTRRGASLLIDRLISKGFLARTSGGGLRIVRDIDGAVGGHRTIKVPLVGSAPCGVPFLAEENVETTYAVSQRLARPGANYFLLRAIGNSMDRAGIKDGDLVLVRQQPVAEKGERVVALIDDEATIKEFQRRGDTIMLVPKSSDAKHQPIILDRDFLIQGVVISTIPLGDEQ